MVQRDAAGFLWSMNAVRQQRNINKRVQDEIRNQLPKTWKNRGGAGGAGTTIRIGKVPTGQQITAATGLTPGSGQVQPWKLQGGSYVDDGAVVTVNNPWSAVIPEDVVVAYQDDANLELIAVDCDTGPELVEQNVPGPVAIASDPLWTDTGLNFEVTTPGLYQLIIAFDAEHTLGNNETVAGQVQFTIGGAPGTGTPVGGVYKWGFGRQSTFADFPVDITAFLDASTTGTVDLWAQNTGDGTLDLVSLAIQQYGPLT